MTFTVPSGRRGRDVAVARMDRKATAFTVVPRRARHRPGAPRPGSAPAARGSRSRPTASGSWSGARPATSSPGACSSTRSSAAPQDLTWPRSSGRDRAVAADPPGRRRPGRLELRRGSPSASRSPTAPATRARDRAPARRLALRPRRGRRRPRRRPVGGQRRAAADRHQRQRRGLVATAGDRRRLRRVLKDGVLNPARPVGGSAGAGAARRAPPTRTATALVALAERRPDDPRARVHERAREPGRAGAARRPPALRLAPTDASDGLEARPTAPATSPSLRPGPGRPRSVAVASSTARRARSASSRARASATSGGRRWSGRRRSSCGAPLDLHRRGRRPPVGPDDRAGAGPAGALPDGVHRWRVIATDRRGQSPRRRPPLRQDGTAPRHAFVPRPARAGAAPSVTAAPADVIPPSGRRPASSPCDRLGRRQHLVRRAGPRIPTAGAAASRCASAPRDRAGNSSWSRAGSRIGARAGDDTAAGGPDAACSSAEHRRAAGELVAALALADGVPPAARPRVVAAMIASADGRATVDGRSVGARPSGRPRAAARAAHGRRRDPGRHRRPCAPSATPTCSTTTSARGASRAAPRRSRSSRRRPPRRRARRRSPLFAEPGARDRGLHRGRPRAVAVRGRRRGRPLRRRRRDAAGGAGRTSRRTRRARRALRGRPDAAARAGRRRRARRPAAHGRAAARGRRRARDPRGRAARPAPPAARCASVHRADDHVFLHYASAAVTSARRSASATARSTPSRGRPLVMGIVNASPDSFSDAVRLDDARRARSRTRELLVADGADIIDVGGESGVTYTAGDRRRGRDRARRAADRAARRRGRARCSVDTYKPRGGRGGARRRRRRSSTTSAACATRGSPTLCARTGAALVVMHTRAAPKQERFAALRRRRRRRRGRVPARAHARSRARAASPTSS